MKWMLCCVVFLSTIGFMSCTDTYPSERKEPASQLGTWNPSMDISGSGYSNIVLSDSSTFVRVDSAHLQIKGTIEIVAMMVTGAKYHDSTDIFSKIGGSYDLALCWGPKNTAKDNINYCHRDGRAAYFNFSRGFDSTKVCNMHLFSVGSRINIDGMRNGDWVKIRGKLINIYYDSALPIYTSVTYEDWSCEMVLVESIEMKRET